MEDSIIYSNSDSRFIKQIGNFIKQSRQTGSLTQQQLADRAGVARSTIVQLESGNSVNLLSLIQILRALNKLEVLQNFQAAPQISPMKMAAMEQQTRLRVRNKKDAKQQPGVSDW